MIKFSHSRQNQNKTYILLYDGFEFLDNISSSYQSSCYLHFTVAFTKTTTTWPWPLILFRARSLLTFISQTLWGMFCSCPMSASLHQLTFGAHSYFQGSHIPFFTSVAWKLCCVDLNVPGDCIHLCLTLALSSRGDAFFSVPLCLANSSFKFQFKTSPPLSCCGRLNFSALTSYY